MMRALHGLPALFLAAFMHAAMADDGALCGRKGTAASTSCGAGSWCEPRPGTCQKAASGTCVRTPEVCTMVYQPVCGCDGKTYGNDCERRRNRVAKKRDGAC